MVAGKDSDPTAHLWGPYDCFLLQFYFIILCVLGRWLSGQADLSFPYLHMPFSKPLAHAKNVPISGACT